eukprot:m.367951 g.367951  ORF g.367951 m.367951 type:complete len:686 (-) comp20840_c0_seq4:142-2199(-)
MASSEFGGFSEGGRDATVNDTGKRVVVALKNGNVASGQLCFAGQISSGADEWLGVRLDTPDGDMDGTVNGLTLFKCDPMHGLFIKVNEMKITIDANQEAPKSRKGSKSSKRKSKGTFGRSARSAKVKLRTIMQDMQQSFRDGGRKIKSVKDLAYHIPILNLIVAFVDSKSTFDWVQVQSLLNVVAIVSALVLALACTFHSALDYSEMEWALSRFSYGSSFNGIKKGLLYNNVKCIGNVSNAQQCIDDSTGFGNDMTGWNATESGPYCEYPCFADRPLDDAGMEEGGNWVTGNYARWWYSKQLGSTFTPLPQAEFVNDPSIDVILTPVELYNRDCLITVCVLSTSLLLSIALVGFSTPNNFLRAEGDSAYGYQYATVMKSFMYWVRWMLLGVIFFTICGIILFFQAIKNMVYCKYTDQGIMETGSYPKFLTAGGRSPYGFTNSAIVWVCYVPLVVSAILLSLAMRALYMFPHTPITDLNETSSREMLARRNAMSESMLQFLTVQCNLPSTTGTAHFGPRVSPCGSFRDDRGIYLTGAGGFQSMDAEVVTDALLDNGIFDIQSLLKLVLPAKYGGIGMDGYEQLFNISAISLPVVLYIREGAKRLVAAANVAPFVPHGYEGPKLEFDSEPDTCPGVNKGQKKIDDIVRFYAANAGMEEMNVVKAAEAKVASLNKRSTSRPSQTELGI